ncbi:MAG: sugar ABC transporter permease [Rhodobiaceae bacterium]|jgi:ABC-2 type transport system permease protein|nr:sugar ABC transporter permease [Rhodobiaceae bacterium]|tara:strand:+ start:17549 stop:18310 length:762 start_codon:yes stop_codon:yes gene_type:complete
MNFQAIKAIYIFEMSRTIRTLIQSIASPVISTVLYFIVFGSAIGSRMQNISDVSYGSFIVPGLILLTVCLQSISNASFGIYFPKFLGTINELLSAPVSYVEIVIGYVSAAVTKSMVIGLIILITASFLVDLRIEHPIWMIAILFLSCVSFSLLGFIIGIWAKSFEQITIVPDLIITPLVFLGGSFYSITLLPEFWQKVTLFNPIVYLISGFRWSFFGNADVSIGYSITAIILFTTICILIIWRIFWTGYRIKS